MYDWKGMQRISYEEAGARFVDNKQVYLLYPDGTEGEATNIEEIDKHYLAGGIFGFEKKITKTEIIKDENEDALRDEVNDFIQYREDVKLTWQAMPNPAWTPNDNISWSVLYICFIEYKEG